MFRRLMTNSQRLMPPGGMRVPGAIRVPGDLRVPVLPTASPSPAWQQPCRLQHNDDRSVVKVLNMESDAGLMVDAFSQVGFRLNNGLSVMGPVALFPRTILSWKVEKASDINEDSLSLFYLLEPKIDLLILGVGDKGSSFDFSIIRFMKQKGINLEIMPTESACTTFNFLNQERRYVAAGLIPPYDLKRTGDDYIRTHLETKALIYSRDDE